MYLIFLFYATLVNVLTNTGMIVSRVRLNRIDVNAYAQCFKAIFDQVTEDHPTFEAGGTLTGIIADWSDHQISGLETVLGKTTTSNIIKGCQVRECLFDK